MLESMHDLRGYTIRATDGEIGKVHEFFFDDLQWTVRYLIVDTGSWLTGRRVLISPASIGQVDHESKTLPVSLTMEQVHNAPDVNTDMPVSRQQETAMAQYYGWPAYWGPDTYVPATGYWMPAPPPPIAAGAGAALAETASPNLRSSREVAGYRIEAVDDDIGHVEDFLIDDDAWSVRYLVVDTRNWLPGKHVLLAPQWVDRIRWADRRVYVTATKQQIESAPEFDGSLPLSRDYEIRLFKHYGRQQYWPA